MPQIICPKCSNKINLSLITYLNYKGDLTCKDCGAIIGINLSNGILQSPPILKETNSIRIDAVSKKLPELKKLDTLQTLELIFSKFHSVARQLRKRHNGRATLEIEDEYDVQDLLHSLLKIYFQDIRPEETTPSYAGGSRRMDFLLKSEKVVIEVKKTRNKLTAKEVGEELLVDIATYSEHPDCNTLICFIYDPEGIISNPVGVETDLAKKSNEKLKVIVYVYPK